MNVKYLKKAVVVSITVVSALNLNGCSSFAFSPEYAFKENTYVKRKSVAAVTHDGSFELSYLTNDVAGRRIIYIHGTPGASVDAYRLIRNAPGNMEVIAVDRLGWGYTQPRKSVPSLESQADAIAPLLIEKDGKKPIVIGHSYGAPIATVLAIKYGERIGGLIQMSGALDPQLTQKFFVQGVANLPILSWFIPNPVRILNQEMLALGSELRSIEPRLAEVTVPMIIIHGTADALVPYENVAFMEKAFSHALILETVTIEGGTHYTPWAREITMYRAINKLAEERFDTPTKDIKLDMTQWVSRRDSESEINKGLIARY